MSFFSSLSDLLESALESIADGIERLADAVPSPSDSSSSSNGIAQTTAREAQRRLALRESAIRLKSFFQQYGMAVSDAEIDELVTACSASPMPTVQEKFERQFAESPAMRTGQAEIEAATAEIERLKEAAETLQALVANGDELQRKERKSGHAKREPMLERHAQ